LLAYERGFKVTKDGNLISSTGKKVVGFTTSNGGYLRYNISDRRGQGFRNRSFMLHRLQAYQKFGDKLFELGLQVRHLNGNSLDNSWDNIEIGTASQNQLDKTVETRKKIARAGAYKQRKFTPDIAEKIIEKYKTEIISIRELAGEHNVSTSTIWYILNGRTYKS